MRTAVLAFVAACVAPAAALAQGTTPLALTGWNRDVITSSAGVGSASSFDNGGAAWYSQGAIQTNLSATPAGLPTAQFTSPALGGTSQFLLQSANANNILAVSSQTGITGVSSSGTLGAAGGVRANSIAVLAASGNGGGALGLTITYAGGVTQTATISAPDWLESFVLDKALATSVGRNSAVSLLNANVNSSGGNLAVTESIRFNLQQTNVTLTRPDLDIQSFTFTADTTANVAGMSGVFAISYSPVPEPAGLLAAAAGCGLGLRRLRRLRRRA